jgi:hypothetical protein
LLVKILFFLLNAAFAMAFNFTCRSCVISACQPDKQGDYTHLYTLKSCKKSKLRALM